MGLKQSSELPRGFYMWAFGSVTLLAITHLTFTRSPVFALAPVAVILAFQAARCPRFALGFWLASLALVPFWITVPLGPVELPPATVASLVVLIGLAVDESNVLRISAADKLLMAAVVLTAVAVAVFGAPSYQLVAILMQGVLAYLTGRYLTQRVGGQATINMVGGFAAICGIWAVLELVSGIHVFENLVGSPNLSFWRVIQERGGYPRAEAAWGHSIALGGWMSLGLPFAIASTLRHRPLAVAAILLGSLATLSRGPILGCLLGVALCVFFLRSVPSARRATLGIATTVAAILAALPILNFIGAVGQELNDTQEYRTGLLDHALQDVHLFGRADATYTDPDGKLIYRGFGSIDNAFLHMAVDTGALIALVLAMGLVAALIRVMRGRGTAADVALATQLLVLFTVAMVTQYQSAVFFVAGVAATLAKSSGAEAPEASVNRRISAVRNRSRMMASPRAAQASA